MAEYQRDDKINQEREKSENYKEKLLFLCTLSLEEIEKVMTDDIPCSNEVLNTACARCQYSVITFYED